ncbi:MAG: hypothetical protein HYZ54_02235 [Ignavibacteriae bacterium]|nr:hypothetical protein [Ignavibacteriota bacterium]
MLKKAPEEREAMVKQWKESGKTMAEWCRERRIPKTIFFCWTRKKKPKAKLCLARNHFTELKSEEPQTGIVIECRGVKIYVEKNFNPTLLTKCLRLIKGETC